MKIVYIYIVWVAVSNGLSINYNLIVKIIKNKEKYIMLFYVTIPNNNNSQRIISAIAAITPTQPKKLPKASFPNIKEKNNIIKHKAATPNKPKKIKLKGSLRIFVSMVVVDFAL